jgi:hypothetical protein
MRSGTVRAGLSLVSLGGITLGVRLVLVPLTDVGPGPISGARPRDTASHAAPAIDSLAQAIVPRDPFRMTRRPASLAYDPVRAAQPPAPTAPKPALVLTGIVWDSRGNPAAVLDGLPGSAGPRVVRPGEQVGALQVRHIARDRVVVMGLDTLWTLTVREPWK